MKTILFAFNLPFHPQRGGTERVVDTLTKSLIKRGYRVIYICGCYPEEYRGYDFPVQNYILPNPNLHSSENYRFYEDLIEKNSVDIVVNHAHVNGYRLFLHTKSASVKRVSVIHSRPSINYGSLHDIKNSTKREAIIRVAREVKLMLKGGKRGYLKRRIAALNFITENSDRVCLLSDKFRAEFLELVPSISPDKLMAIPNPNTFPRVEKSLKKRKLILFIGRLSDEKRADRAINIWKLIYKEFTDWEIIFIGDGPDRASLERTARGIDRINFIGFQDPKPYLEEASILCSTSNYEGWPMTLSEAMVHGVVPISFNSYASVTDIIKDGKDGLLITPFSLEEYREKLSALMSDHQRVEEMSKAAQESIERFNIERITDRWESVFNTLLTESNK